MVDKSYQLVASHLDDGIQEKIVNREYVDFERLVPKDRVLVVDDSTYEMIVRDGKTYWVPASNYENTSISNYKCWEQAFWVYSDVYMRAHPQRAPELVQYNHLIHTTSQSYTWENVYLYDKDFRLHLARHPNRSWSIILQQAWVMRLKDRIRTNTGNHNSTGGEHKKDICKRFNKGKCNYGSECVFDHHCSYCFKFGHGVVNCRRLKAIMSQNQRDGYDRDKRDRYDWYERQHYERQHRTVQAKHYKIEHHYDMNKNNNNSNDKKSFKNNK